MRCILIVLHARHSGIRETNRRSSSVSDSRDSKDWQVYDHHKNTNFSSQLTLLLFTCTSTMNPSFVFFLSCLHLISPTVYSQSTILHIPEALRLYIACNVFSEYIDANKDSPYCSDSLDLIINNLYRTTNDWESLRHCIVVLRYNMDST